MKQADIIILIAILMAGCVTTKEPRVNSPIPIENYDEDVLRAKASDLNMRLVDYLHALSNGRIADLRKQPFALYQAYDANWSDDPSINPVFATKMEAEKYASENNMGGNHSYKVREVTYRFEVRRVNDVDNDLLYTSRTHNDAYEYVTEYSSSHADLIIYDLKTGKSFEETP